MKAWKKLYKFSHPTAFPTGIEYFRDHAQTFEINVNLWPSTHVTDEFGMRECFSAAELPRVEAAPPRPSRENPARSQSNDAISRNKSRQPPRPAAQGRRYHDWPSFM